MDDRQSQYQKWKNLPFLFGIPQMVSTCYTGLSARVCVGVLIFRFRNKVLDLRFLLRVNCPQTELRRSAARRIPVLGNTHIVEQKQGLHEHAHAVHAVGFHIVDCIQQIQKRFQTRHVLDGLAGYSMDWGYQESARHCE